MSSNDWKKALKESFHSPLELLEFLQIVSDQARVSLNIAKKFIVVRFFRTGS
ncbi:Lysyl-lysine 2,3-aminomutase [Francisella sp. MA067296]|nr:Lysyl-lysine 2,3-aminomutase [Francisella sp. MA067296]